MPDSTHPFPGTVLTALAIVVLAACGGRAEPSGGAATAPATATVTTGSPSGSAVPSTGSTPDPIVELAAGPLDLDLVGNTGYLTLSNGQILRLQLAGRDLVLSPVADGLGFLRGVARSGNVLFVGGLGPMLCPEPFYVCQATHIDPANPPAGEAAQVDQSSGFVKAFEILSDGTLSEPTTVLEGIPVVNTDHGVNDLEVGPEGSLYVAVGNIDATTLERRPIHHPHADWLGTVLRVDPALGAVEVFARGLRNVYGMVFSGHGELIGADNDGVTRSGDWRYEELVVIERGSDHGFPDAGTFTPGRGDRILTLLPQFGSGGLALDDSGAFIGGCGQVLFQPLSRGSSGELVAPPRTSARVLTKIDGCASIVERLGDGLLVGYWSFLNEPPFMRGYLMHLPAS